jgi:hypothetical protein
MMLCSASEASEVSSPGERTGTLLYLLLYYHANIYTILASYPAPSD